MGIDYQIISEAICVYFDCKNGGIMPWPHKENIIRRYPHDYEEILSEIEMIVNKVMQYQIDWNNNTLSSAGDIIEREIEKDYPNIASEARKALANYFTYNWR